MPFSVNCFVADTDDKIVTVDWEYTNADGAVSNTHVLSMPAGDVPLSAVTQSTLVGWVEAQLANTADDFDAAIADAKTQAEYQAGCKKYEREADETYAIAAEEYTAPM